MISKFSYATTSPAFGNFFLQRFCLVLSIQMSSLLPTPENALGYTVALIVGLTPSIVRGINNALRRGQTDQATLLSASATFRQDMTTALEQERKANREQQEAQLKVSKALEDRITELEAKLEKALLQRMDLVQRELELKDDMFKLKRQCLTNEDTIFSLQRKDETNARIISELQQQNIELQAMVAALQARLQIQEDAPHAI